MRLSPSLAALALAGLAACDMPTTAGVPASAALDGNTVTLAGGCRAAAPQGIGLTDSFSVVYPCPGIVEIGVARLRDPDVHVVQIVPIAVGPLSTSGQSAAVAAIEVTVMFNGGSVAGYVGRP